MSKIYVDEILPKDNATVDGSKLSAVPASAISTLNSSAMPTGSVLQVVQAEYSTQIASTDSTQFTLVSASITPTSTSSKIYVTGTVMGIMRGTTNSASRINVKLYRDSTLLNNSGANFYTFSTSVNLRHGGFHIDDLDSPSTTSATTYSIQCFWTDTTSSYVNKDGNSGNSTITLMEIAG